MGYANFAQATNARLDRCAALTQEALARLGYSSGSIDDYSGGRVPSSKADRVKAISIRVWC